MTGRRGRWASATPLTAALLVETFADAGAPPNSVSLLQRPNGEIGRALLADPRVGFFALRARRKTAGLFNGARVCARRNQHVIDAEGVDEDVRMRVFHVVANNVEKRRVRSHGHQSQFDH